MLIKSPFYTQTHNTLHRSAVYHGWYLSITADVGSMIISILPDRTVYSCVHNEYPLPSVYIIRFIMQSDGIPRYLTSISQLFEFPLLFTITTEQSAALKRPYASTPYSDVIFLNEPVLSSLQIL